LEKIVKKLLLLTLFLTGCDFTAVKEMPVFDQSTAIFTDFFPRGLATDPGTDLLQRRSDGGLFWSNNSSPSIQPGADAPCTITVREEFFDGGVPFDPPQYSVVAHYDGSPDLTADGRPELRFALGGQYSELWISFRLFIPENYYHRVPIGTGNNKFLILWATTATTDQYFDIELWPAANGGDEASFNSKYGNVARGHKFPATPWGIGGPADRGHWTGYLVHMKLATTATANDGAMEIWKGIGTDWKKVMDFQNLQHYTEGGNFFSNGYIFGASNSGWNVDTELRLRDFVVSAKAPVSVPTGVVLP
jgi:hypothetical protein